MGNCEKTLNNDSLETFGKEAEVFNNANGGIRSEHDIARFDEILRLIHTIQATNTDSTDLLRTECRRV